MDLDGIYAQLVPELKQPEYDGLSDAAALAHLLGRTESVPWGVPWKTLASWAAGNGVRALLQLGADNTAQTAEAIGIRSICLAVLDNIRGGLSEMLDCTDEHIVGTGGMLDALVAAGILTSGQKAELIALGTLTRPLPWVAGVELGHVSSARQLIAEGN